MVTFENVQPLYEKYLDLVRFEVETLDVKPTEIRHLIGRLGEFHCVKEVQGSLPARANQPGFDVLSLGGRRISVKTTAQITGFVTISKRTLQGADDLMLVQYAEGRTNTIFHGCIQRATQGTRLYGGSYELDISRARKLAMDVPSTP